MFDNVANVSFSNNILFEKINLIERKYVII